MSDNDPNRLPSLPGAADGLRRSLGLSNDLQRLTADLNVTARLGVKPAYLETVAASVQAQFAVAKFDLRLGDLARSLGTTATAYQAGGVSRLSDAIKSLNAVSPGGAAGAIAAYHNRLSTQFDSLKLATPIRDVIQHDVRRWTKSLESMSVNLSAFRSIAELPVQTKLAVASWDSVLGRSLQSFTTAGLIDRRADVCARLLEPSRVFSKFAVETLALIGQTSDVERSRALNASLLLAESQQRENSEQLATFISATEDDEPVSTARTLANPYFQRDDLLNSGLDGEAGQVADLVALSPTAQTASLASSVLKLATRCNKAGSVNGLKEIFKPTTRTMEVCIDLPMLTPVDEQGFGEFIDCLNILFYEGAGKDNLRFLQTHGGPLTENDCDLIWAIKAFRNKWLRHDADHGKESAIEKSWLDLGRQFKRYGLSGYPRSTEDFRRLHHQMLQEAETFLLRLFQGL